MNAAEEDVDSKLQKASGDLIKDLDAALIKYIRKPDGRGGTRVRSWARASSIFPATCQALDMFQELPQLLDPHLQKWITLLATSYLEYLLRDRASSRSKVKSPLLVPIDHAICKILYTFCKVRGEKVIVRFLNVEAKYLEPLLSAVEEADERSQQPDNERPWSWEQRYIVVLWLSHLLLAPFDLATISSTEFEDSKVPDIPNLSLADTLPGITKRIIPLGVKYLASPGKERDAAKALLVRMAMRRDMQQLGVLQSLVQWSLASLTQPVEGTADTTYFYIGVLSFLAGVLRSSSETSDMSAFLEAIFNVVYGLTVQEMELAKHISSFAVARKMILKVIQSVVVICLRQPSQTMEHTVMTETAIGSLLESVSDNDTPVRMAASKSLSVITLKLDPEMASQVVEAVLESLNRNVLWRKTQDETGAKSVRDLSAVNHLEWHGLMLTLSHLLYRRSPPPVQLSDIIHALLLGLSFDQRSTSGASVGSNVRDASCFGIWALARRYTTTELLAVPLESVFAAKSHPQNSSIIQVLATELVMSASLDPFGNIRRGASAALQELIGRHPDTVEQGIAVVQTVDYHAVARRSRAIGEVAINASKLANQYAAAALDAILGWRGVGDAELAARQDAGSAFGSITTEIAKHGATDDADQLRRSFSLVNESIKNLTKRQVEERHGLLLCFSGLLDQLPNLDIQVDQHASLLEELLAAVVEILINCKETTYRRPELIAVAASRLALSCWPLLQMLALKINSLERTLSGSVALSPARPLFTQADCDALQSISSVHQDIGRFKVALKEIVPLWLDASEGDTIEPTSMAALLLTMLLPGSERGPTMQQWCEVVGIKPATRDSRKGYAYFYILAMSSLGKSIDGPSPLDALLQRWNNDNDINTRIAILQSLIYSHAAKTSPESLLNLLADALTDYTTTAQGDIGSQLRVQALRAVQILWKNVHQGEPQPWFQLSVNKLFYLVLRLSAEKLDKVRLEAQIVLSVILSPAMHESFLLAGISSADYFTKLLTLQSSTHLHESVASLARADPLAWISQLLTGYVSSADTGNEDLVIRSRQALTAFCSESTDKGDLVCQALLNNLKDYQGDDRILVPTLEIVVFLFNVGIFQRRAAINYKSVCLQAQKAAYKSGNVRKILAAVKVYGAIASKCDAEAAIPEARKRLGALMGHPWPKVRTAVVDELWMICEDSPLLTGVDWGRADKAQVAKLVQDLQL